MTIQHYHQNTRIGWQYADNNILQPVSTGKISSWLSLQASDQSGGEWNPSIVDLLNPSNPVTQTDTDRRSAVGTTNNGYLTMDFDGSDMHVWPVSSTINNMTTKLGFWFWFNPGAVNVNQRLIYAAIAAGGCSSNKIDIYANNRTIIVDVYITNANGRSFLTGNILTAGTWSSLYVQYDSSRGGDANLALFQNGSSVSTTPSNIGAGGTLTTLQQPTGNIFIGSASNVDAPAVAIANGGRLGPNLFAMNDNLNTFEIDVLQNFMKPT